MYGWIVNRLRNAEVKHIKNGEDKLAVLCRDAASVVVELNTSNKTLRELLHDRDITIDSLNVSLETYRGLVEAMQHNQQAQWTPMTKRQPPEELCFYSCYTDKGVIVECLWTNNRTGLGPLDEWGWRFMDVPSHQHITHWMPLPEPPKEEEKI